MNDDLKFVDPINRFDPRLPSPTDTLNAERAANTPEPPPTPNDKPPIWPLVVDDVRVMMSVHPKDDVVKNLVVADMRARDDYGRAHYGTPLQPWNGRDALVDAYQEALDLCVYLKQALVEKYDGMLRALYLDILGTTLELRGIIESRSRVSAR